MKSIMKKRGLVGRFLRLFTILLILFMVSASIAYAGEGLGRAVDGAREAFGRAVEAVRDFFSGGYSV